MYLLECEFIFNMQWHLSISWEVEVLGHTMSMYVTVEVELHLSWTLALNGGKWSSLHPGLLTWVKWAPFTGWMFPRTNLNSMKKGKSLAPARNSPKFLCNSACRLVIIPTVLFWQFSYSACLVKLSFGQNERQPSIRSRRPRPYLHLIPQRFQCYGICYHVDW